MQTALTLKTSWPRRQSPNQRWSHLHLGQSWQGRWALKQPSRVSFCKRVIWKTQWITWKLELWKLWRALYDQLQLNLLLLRSWRFVAFEWTLMDWSLYWWRLKKSKLLSNERQFSPFLKITFAESGRKPIVRWKSFYLRCRLGFPGPLGKKTPADWGCLCQKVRRELVCRRVYNRPGGREDLCQGRLSGCPLCFVKGKGLMLKVKNWHRRF